MIEQFEIEIAKELLGVWVEAKSSYDADYLSLTWDNLPEKHQAEYLLTAKRILALRIGDYGLKIVKEVSNDRAV